MVKNSDIQEMIEDYTRRYLGIIEKNGICKKSNEYAAKIDRLEMLKKDLSSWQLQLNLFRG